MRKSKIRMLCKRGVRMHTRNLLGCSTLGASSKINIIARPALPRLPSLSYGVLRFPFLF